MTSIHMPSPPRGTRQNINNRPTMVDKCMSYFDLNPYPNEDDKLKIMNAVGCSKTTVYDAYRNYRNLHPEIYGSAASGLPQGKSVTDTVKRERTAKKKAEAAKKKKEFSVPKGTDFITFCKKWSFPFYKGLYKWQIEAHRYLWESVYDFLMLMAQRNAGKSIYLGNLFQWLMDPDAGTEQWDILYLGWTDRRKAIALSVYQYFEIKGDLSSKKDTELHFKLKSGARFDTYLISAKETLGDHSVGVFGREFDKENEVLKKYLRDPEGRKLLICIDDPIDISFMDERHKERKLEIKFDSTLYSINPDRWLFVGTKKFDGDIFTFWENKFKDDLRSYIRCPYVPYKRKRRSSSKSAGGGESNLNMNIQEKKGIYTKENTPTNDANSENNIPNTKNSPENFLLPRQQEDIEQKQQKKLTLEDIAKLPEREIHKLLKQRKIQLLCPELFTHPALVTYQKDRKPKYNAKGKKIRDRKKCLLQIRTDIGEYMWSAEYCQNPHPITGEVWEKVKYAKVRKDWTHYDILVIGLDRATSDNPTSSYTGYVAELRDKNGKRLVIFDKTGFWSFEDLLKDVNDYIVEHKKVYRNIEIFLVIERQGGGDDFYSSAMGRIFPFLNYCTVIMVFTSERNKKERIKNYLYAPIRNEMIEYLDHLNNSELVIETLTYPHSKRLDALDAQALIEAAMTNNEQIPKLAILDGENLKMLANGLRAYTMNRNRSTENDDFGLITSEVNRKKGGYW